MLGRVSWSDRHLCWRAAHGPPKKQRNQFRDFSDDAGTKEQPGTQAALCPKVGFWSPLRPFKLLFTAISSDSWSICSLTLSDSLPSTLPVLRRSPRLRTRFGRGSTPMVPVWGRCTTHFRAYFSGDWDVHWGFGIGFDP